MSKYQNELRSFVDQGTITKMLRKSGGPVSPFVYRKENSISPSVRSRYLSELFDVAVTASNKQICAGRVRRESQMRGEPVDNSTQSPFLRKKSLSELCQEHLNLLASKKGTKPSPSNV